MNLVFRRKIFGGHPGYVAAGQISEIFFAIAIMENLIRMPEKDYFTATASISTLTPIGSAAT